MKSLPYISIVVPSYNQGKFIDQTLQSLVDQEYPNLQVIIQDGGSTDGAADIAQQYVQRFPHIFELFIEKDDGQADAINRGFARARGSILGFLNSDDTLYPRILHRVAHEIDPRQGRYIVMGRCLFIGENSRYVGVEHPAEYHSHFDQLAIWRRGYNTIPQPSVFWHRDVTKKTGWLDINEHHALDYDLFCRFSRHYHFHRIDELFSTYRMHDDSKSSQRTEAEILELSIRVSRKHWGPWWSPLRWRLALSHWTYARQFHEHARHYARQAEEAFQQRRLLRAGKNFMMTWLYSPSMAYNRLFCGWLARRKSDLLSMAAIPQYSHTGQYPDGWIGPYFTTTLHVPENAEHLEYSFEYVRIKRHRNFNIQLLVEGTDTDHHRLTQSGNYTLKAPIAPWRGKDINIEIRCTSFFIPSLVLKNSSDTRSLSVKLSGHRFMPAATTTSRSFS